MLLVICTRDSSPIIQNYNLKILKNRTYIFYQGHKSKSHDNILIILLLNRLPWSNFIKGADYIISSKILLLLVDNQDSLDLHITSAQMNMHLGQFKWGINVSYQPLVEGRNYQLDLLTHCFVEMPKKSLLSCFHNNKTCHQYFIFHLVTQEALGGNLKAHGGSQGRKSLFTNNCTMLLITQNQNCGGSIIAQLKNICLDAEDFSFNPWYLQRTQKRFLSETLESYCQSIAQVISPAS